MPLASSGRHLLLTTRNPNWYIYLVGRVAEFLHHILHEVQNFLKFILLQAHWAIKQKYQVYVALYTFYRGQTQRDLVKSLWGLACPCQFPCMGNHLEVFLPTGSPVPYPDSQGALAAPDHSDSGGRGNTGHLDRCSGHMSETAQGHRPEGIKDFLKGWGFLLLCVFRASSTKNKSLQGHHPPTSFPSSNWLLRQGNSASRYLVSVSPSPLPMLYANGCSLPIGQSLNSLVWHSYSSQ